MQLLLSIIGCVTGMCSLILYLNKYFLEKPKLKIYLDRVPCSYYFKNKDFNVVPSFNCTYSAVISLRIDNCSAYPATISDIQVKSKHTSKRSYHNGFFTFEEPGIPAIPQGRYMHPTSETFELPIRIDPFDSFFGCVQISFFDPFVIDEITPSHIIMEIHTPRKIFYFPVSLYEYEYLYNKPEHKPSLH